MSKMITKPQITLIHVLLNKLDLIAGKKDIVEGWTGYRTTSTKEMTMKEANGLIACLKEEENPKNNMIRKVFALGYDIGIIWGNSDVDLRINKAKIDMFLISRGTVKKKLFELSFAELKKVLRQFEQMKKANYQSKFNKQLKEILTSNNIKNETKQAAAKRTS